MFFDLAFYPAISSLSSKKLTFFRRMAEAATIKTEEGVQQSVGVLGNTLNDLALNAGKYLTWRILLAVI